MKAGEPDDRGKDNKDETYDAGISKPSLFLKIIEEKSLHAHEERLYIWLQWLVQTQKLTLWPGGGHMFIAFVL